MNLKKKKRNFNVIITRVVRFIFLLECLVAIFLGIFGWEDGRFGIELDGQSFMNAFVSLLGFTLTFIPEATERLLKNRIRFSSALKCAIVLFIFGAEFLGEINNFYYHIPWWDTLLHTTSGVILAMIGFMLVHALNNSDRMTVQLSLFFIALFAFTFALASGVVWEIFEYSGDRLFGMDMQKYLPPDGVVYEHTASGMTKLIYPTNGEWSFDAGLIDTMDDIICDTLAALAVSIIGFISLKTRNHTLKKLAHLPVDFDEEKEAAPDEPVPAVQDVSDESRSEDEATDSNHNM